ncbi:hypothetical protein RchiOBHm_Chr7g0204171 [Rosa chinensis]|uniref:Uncharacterized protein n=1 Tax=Rosa chinensis TaxID=74649 RepID=A0A2P6P8L6_ROSCH|nr:hypothetical protein RchiOBHm_Chr7g0204171 [Rosa chinensis]
MKASAKRSYRKRAKSSYRIGAWKIPKLGSNEAMRVAKLAKLLFYVNFWMYILLGEYY